MSRTIKNGTNIIISSPEVDFSVPLIKFNSAPTTNNSNTEYLTRNTGTGNIERVTTLPTIYNTNGNITANRIVTTTAANLTFKNNGGTDTFLLDSWNVITLNALTLNTSSGFNTTIAAGGIAAVNGGVVTNIGTTATTTNISANTKALNIDSSTTKLNNITIQPGGLPAGEFVFLNRSNKEIRCENVPTAYVSQQILSFGLGPTLTTTSPSDIDGPDVQTISALNYLFQGIGTNGTQYNTALGIPATTFFVRRFEVKFDGDFVASVAQEYSAGILINGVLDNDTVKKFTYSGSTYLPFSTRTKIILLNNGDTVKLALGRATSNATFVFSGNLIITPVAYY